MLKRYDWLGLKEPDLNALTQRPGGDLEANFTAVRTIIDDVKRDGDIALRELTRRFDQVGLDELEVSADEWSRAIDSLSGGPLQSALELACANIRTFHSSQLPASVQLETSPGVRCWRRFTPIERVGLYVPGGRAPLVSTVLMLGLPAALAGCENRILCTPPQKDGSVNAAILLAARIAGVQRVFKVGGAQAIAAMALGTETLPKVDKIFGPGNRFVTAAKALVSLPPYATGIDTLAGPSELLVIADESANAGWLAADLISQAEHGPDSQVVLVSESASLLDRVDQELERQLLSLPDQSALGSSLEISFSLLVPSLREAVHFANVYAPEHLELSCRAARSISEDIRNAGSVFVGACSSVVYGDYVSGTNHTLPTGATARYAGGLTLESFLKPVSFQAIDPEGVLSLSHAMITLTEAEGLLGHQRAAALRTAECVAREFTP